MTASRISTTVTHTVTLGSKRYTSPLTITPTGVIDVTQTYGAVGITGAQAGDQIINHGSVTAGHGSHATRTESGGAGGVGVDLTAGGTIVSAGMIAGGFGGSGGTYNYGGAGGNGINSAGGKIVNSGTIKGGAAGFHNAYAFEDGHSGGIGVDVTGAGLALTNSGTIAGGASNFALSGGVGVDFNAAGTLRNTGTIHGGPGEGTTSGTGVVLTTGCALVNGGEINGYTAGVGLVAAGSKTTNFGTIVGGGGDSGSVGNLYFATAGRECRLVDRRRFDE